MTKSIMIALLIAAKVYAIAATTAIVIAVALATIGMLLFGSGCNVDGITPVSDGQAVYIAGESCTINATMDRTGDEIMADAMVCAMLHDGERALGDR